MQGRIWRRRSYELTGFIVGKGEQRGQRKDVGLDARAFTKYQEVIFTAENRDMGTQDPKTC